MLVQHFVRGIAGLSPADVSQILSRTGMLCSALRTNPGADVWDAEQRLGSDALDLHQNRYDLVGADSPYISTSAGTYVGEAAGDGSGEGTWRAKFAVDTAVQFAVLISQTDGWVFSGYHLLLGRPAGAHAEFGEELRDVHQHPIWSTWRSEGEVAAAVRIPPRRLQRADFYSYDDVRAAIDDGRRPAPVATAGLVGEHYVEPTSVLSVREVI